MACKHKSRVWDNGWCNVACMYCTLAQESHCEHKKQTNAERIVAGGVTVMAQTVVDAVADGCPPNMDWDCMKDEHGWDGCQACWERWLQAPAEGGDDNGN